MTLAITLQNKRKELKFTQEEVAEKICVSRQTISNWETGRTLPDITSLILISELYSISLDELIKNDKQVVNNLILDMKQATQWFTTAALFNALFSSFLCTEMVNSSLKINVLLLVIQALSTAYIGKKGLVFLKKRQEMLISSQEFPKSKWIIDEYSVLYGVTIFGGIFATLSGILKL